MKKSKQILSLLFLAVLLISALCVPAFAITESEVETQVAASGKEAVTGNVLIWFLCAVAFLKVSQKIDSFMATLGVNVGRTGGSMLAEAMVAMRTVTMVMGGKGGAGAGHAVSASRGASGKAETSGMTGFFKGGLVGMAGRHITNSAVRTATTRTSAVHTAQSQLNKTATANAAGQMASNTQINNDVHTGGSSIHTEHGVSAGTAPQKGVIVTGGETPSQVTSVENVPSVNPVYNVSASQTGTTIPQTGATTIGDRGPNQTVSMENTSPIGPIPDVAPPQEGVILTGNETSPLVQQVDGKQLSGSAPLDNMTPFLGQQVNDAQQVADASLNDVSTDMTSPLAQQIDGAQQVMSVSPDGVPIDMAPTQDGVILTGSESPPVVPMPTPVPQAADMQPEGFQADVTPSQEGIVVIGGDTSIHASQAGDTLSVNSTNPPPQTGTANGDGGRYTQVHSKETQTSHTSASSEKVHTSRFHLPTISRPTLGGTVFSKSLASGGSFANDVIGTVARGEVAGSITGDMAAQSLTSYMGHTSPGIGSREAPVYSDVEIGRGRISGVETTAGATESRAFAMYHVDQYIAPTGDYTKVVSADGTQWYKQYAQDAVERKPYKAPDDTVAYHERIVKKLPDPPKRKDRI